MSDHAGGQGFGVDIGGSGIKGALVDLRRGALAGDRYRLDTPAPSTPDAVAHTVAEVVDHFGWSGAFGATFPAVIAHGVARTAANVDPSWVGTDVRATLSRPGRGPVTVLNDADAAGLAEVRYGAARDVAGVTVVVTLGTGIGTALFVDGTLVPNTELGHLELDGHDAERRASDAARERHDLSWEHWAQRVERYLRHLEDLLWPDLLVVGGGVSRKAEKWLPHVTTRTRLVPAELQNGAGIVGAAIAASETAATAASYAAATAANETAATAAEETAAPRLDA